MPRVGQPFETETFLRSLRAICEKRDYMSENQTAAKVFTKRYQGTVVAHCRVLPGIAIKLWEYCQGSAHGPASILQDIAPINGGHVRVHVLQEVVHGPSFTSLPGKDQKNQTTIPQYATTCRDSWSKRHTSGLQDLQVCDRNMVVPSKTSSALCRRIDKVHIGWRAKTAWQNDSGTFSQSSWSASVRAKGTPIVKEFSPWQTIVVARTRNLRHCSNRKGILP